MITKIKWWDIFCDAKIFRGKNFLWWQKNCEEEKKMWWKTLSEKKSWWVKIFCYDYKAQINSTQQKMITL